jgi:hypothetical protein
MQFSETRRVQRVHLAQPVLARLGATQVRLVDVSVLGARVEHHVPLLAGGRTRLSFRWDDEEIVTECRIVRSRLERFSVGGDGLTIYHSGLEFENVAPEMRGRLKAMIARFISRALEEQKLNARGVVPLHDVNRMPIFRFGGQLTANTKDVKEAAGSSALPTSRMTAEVGFVSYQFENNQWREKRTHDPGQPLEGFTISALEDHEQAQMLCDAYQRSDREGRRMIQLFARLSIVEGDSVMVAAAPRFHP